MTTAPVQSITDEQIAELEFQYNETQKRGGAVLLNSDWLGGLLTRLREAERDAARYRWLRDRGDAYQWENILGFDLDDFMMEDDALDHAIDVYMQDHKQ